MIWWLQDKVRLAAEIRGLDRLAADEPWLVLEGWTQHELLLAVDLRITAHGVDYPVRLVFPDTFPDVPAWIVPQDADTKWSGHQFGPGGSLCLEWRTDTWTPSLTGVDLVLSAHRLLDRENPLGDGPKAAVASAHDVTPVQRFDWDATQPVLVDADCLSRIEEGVVDDLRAVRWYPAGERYLTYVTDAQSRTSGSAPPVAGGPYPFFETPVFVTAAAAPEGPAPTRASVADAAGFDIVTRAQFDVAETALVVFGVPGASAPIFVFDGAEARRRKWWPFSTQGGERTGAPPARRDAKIAVVGCGSVGSKLAETLVRSGVRTIVLVDGDILLPPNLERNALDWIAVGARKVAGLKAKLLAIVPQAVIVDLDTNLSWQRSPRVHAKEIGVIVRCDVIVDATGDPGTALLLGSLAARMGKPFVSVEVFEGGIGALVATCVPDRDPPYPRARANFEAWCEVQGERFPRPPAAPYGGFDEDGAPIVADDATVTVAVGLAGRTILDIADKTPAPQARAWQLIGLSDAWVFGRLGRFIGLSVGDPPPPAPPEVDPEIAAFVQERLQELLDALAPAK